MRSPIWFVVAALVAIGGFVAAGFHIFSGIGAIEDKLTQVVMPGSATVTLAQPGTYTIYYERHTVVDGRVYAASGLGGLRVSLQAPDGSDVPLTSRTGSTYRFGSREGRSIFAFTAATAGDYRISGALPDGRSEPKVVLAVESGLLGGMFSMIVGGVAMVFGGLALGGTILGVTLWQRHRAKRMASSPVH